MKPAKFLGLMLVLVMIAMVYISIDAEKAIKKLQKDKTELTLKVASLEEALTQKMTSLCDTATVEEKLKQIEFEKYAFAMYEAQEKDELAAWKTKETEEFAAYKAKEKLDSDAWNIYSKTRYAAFKTLASTDPRNFEDYAIADFWDEHAAGDDGYKYWQKKNKMEENVPSIKDFISLDKQAYTVKQATEKSLNADYQKNLEDINTDYNSKLSQIKAKYQKLLAEKKTQLGL